MFWASLCVFVLGNTDNYQSFTVLLTHPDLTKLVVWDTKPSKVTLFTELESEEVVVRSSSEEVLLRESPLPKVSHNLSSKEVFVRSLKKELEEELGI